MTGIVESVISGESHETHAVISGQFPGLSVGVVSPRVDAVALEFVELLRQPDAAAVIRMRSSVDGRRLGLIGTSRGVF